MCVCVCVCVCDIGTEDVSDILKMDRLIDILVSFIDGLSDLELSTS